MGMLKYIMFCSLFFCSCHHSEWYETEKIRLDSTRNKLHALLEITKYQSEIIKEETIVAQALTKWMNHEITEKQYDSIKAVYDMHDKEFERQDSIYRAKWENY